VTRYPQGILVSCEVPWDGQGRLCDDLFRREVRHFLAQGFRDIYIFGTAGEGYAVDTARFRDVLNVFFEETRGEGVRAQCGVIALSTAQYVERIGIAHGAGFRVFQISLPAWGALNDTEMLRFFRDVCGAFPDSKFLHYNLLRTKRLVTGAEYRRIADAVPNLVATKNTSPSVDHTIDLIRHSPDLQHYLGEWTFPLGTLWGECSLLSSFAPMLPARSREIFAAAKEGRTADLFRLHQKFLAVALEVLAPMRRTPLIDGAYDKLLVRLGGFDMPSGLLSPYDAFPESVYEECRAILEKHAAWAKGVA
jgi:dihydrodipicolinate synthase/N-acetylneuraminate lyase